MFQIINKLLFWGAVTGMADKDEELAMPRDAKIVKSLMKSMGVEDYEPRVVHKINFCKLVMKLQYQKVGA